MSVVAPSVAGMRITAREADRTGCTMSYDDRAGRDPARWPAVDHGTLLEACSGGVLVVRLARDEEPATSDSWSHRAEALRHQPDVGFAAWHQVRAGLSRHRRLACVATVCGYPVLLADLVGFVARGEHVELGLEPPGEWSRHLHRRRLVTRPGPRWLVLGAQSCPGRVVWPQERSEPVNAGRSTTWSRWA
jgi:hypothetical protein